MSRLLVDTNVLLRAIDVAHPAQPVAERSLRPVAAAGVELVYCNQTFAEFLQVATRSKNGFRLLPTVAFAAFDRLASNMTWLPEPQSVYDKLRELYDAGLARPAANVHDAKLAALGLLHGLDGILTFNDRDFRRSGLPVVTPS